MSIKDKYNNQGDMAIFIGYACKIVSSTVKLVFRNQRFFWKSVKALIQNNALAGETLK